MKTAVVVGGGGAAARSSTSVQPLLPAQSALRPDWPEIATPRVQSASEHFSEVVRELKRSCGVQYVLCWHAMMGYWSGAMPGVRQGSSVPACCGWQQELCDLLPQYAHLAWRDVTCQLAGLPLVQAPGVAKYRPRLMYPRPSPGTLEVDPSMQVGLRVAWGPGLHPIAQPPRVPHT